MPLVRWILFHLLRPWTTEWKCCVTDVPRYGAGHGWQLPLVGDVCRTVNRRRVYRW